MITINLKSLLRAVLTLLILALAVLLGLWMWNHWMTSAWTRDGRVRGDVINLAPDVSGLVTAVNVHDNQLVHQGDVLFVIDRQRFEHAVTEAESAAAVRRADLAQRRSEAARRAKLEDVVISSESKEASGYGARIAEAQLQQALATLETAKLNLARTEIRAPVDGYVTNLATYVGDYAGAGRAAMALIDAHSFYIYGYFEETKIPLLHIDQAVSIRLIGSSTSLRGHIESLSRGITDRDNATGQELLSNVNPTFNWVRLAQRVPVRIRLDPVPADVLLSAGMTCTIIVDSATADARSDGPPPAPAPASVPASALSEVVVPLHSASAQQASGVGATAPDRLNRPLTRPAGAVVK